MFNQCTSLSATPNLPASSLANYCYYNMFKNCTNLSSEIYLSAYELAEGCYFGMFYGCSHLTDVVITAYDLADNAMNSMFMGCTRLSSIYVEFTDWENAAYSTDNWVSGVADQGLFTKPEDLAEEYGDSRIPSGWLIQQFTAP